jgi:UDP:flavonoid glycosyltransferase YjiC (YdhE family)
VKEAVAFLLASDAHRKAARRMMAEIAALPGQESAVNLITKLARRGSHLVAS